MADEVCGSSLFSTLAWKFVLQCVRRTFTAILPVSSIEAGADSSALSNGLPSLRSQTVSLHCSRFFCIRSADQRGAAEDGQASGGMIKREFCHEKLACRRTLLQPHHSFCYRRGRSACPATTRSFLPSRTRRHLRSPTIVERIDHIRRRRTA